MVDQALVKLIRRSRAFSSCIICSQEQSANDSSTFYKRRQIAHRRGCQSRALYAATQDIWLQANECGAAWGELDAENSMAAAGGMFRVVEGAQEKAGTSVWAEQ